MKFNEYLEFMQDTFGVNILESNKEFTLFFFEEEEELVEPTRQSDIQNTVEQKAAY
jgi:hypothetical protein